MPTYTYRCKACLKEFNVKQSIYEDPLKCCTEILENGSCKGQVFRVIGKNIGIQFSGSGFYINDQNKNSKTKPSSSTNPRKTNTKPKQEKQN